MGKVWVEFFKVVSFALRVKLIVIVLLVGCAELSIALTLPSPLSLRDNTLPDNVKSVSVNFVVSVVSLSSTANSVVYSLFASKPIFISPITFTDWTIEETTLSVFALIEKVLGSVGGGVPPPLFLQP